MCLLHCCVNIHLLLVLGSLFLFLFLRLTVEEPLLELGNYLLLRPPFEETVADFLFDYGFRLKKPSPSCNAIYTSNSGLRNRRGIV